MFHFSKKSIKFFIYTALFLFTARAHASSPHYEKIIPDLTEQSVLVPKSKSIPYKAKKYLDKENKYKCSNLPVQELKKVKIPFNPGFYTGTLWLDLTFSDTKQTEGSDYYLYFGHEHIDFAEVFLDTGDEWKFLGRTGRSISTDEITYPNWRLCIPFSEVTFPEEKEHHIRIRLVSYIGSPVIVSIVPKRVFDSSQSFLEFYTYCIFGIFILISLMLLAIGIGLKEKPYLALAGAAFTFTILQMQMRGIGPVYLWNGLMTKIPHSVRIMYILTVLYVIFLITFFTVHLKRKKQDGTAFIILPFLLTISTGILILCFIVHSPAIMFCIFVIGMITVKTIFCACIFSDLKYFDKNTKLILTLWTPGLIISVIMQSASILRTMPEFSFLTFFSKTEDNLVFTTDFLLLTLPAIYTVGITFRQKYSSVRTMLQYTKENYSELRKKTSLTFMVIKTLAESSFVMKNAAALLAGRISEKNEQEYADIIKYNSARINDYLKAVCVFENKNELKNVPIQILPFFNSCIKASEKTAAVKENKITVTTEVSADCVVYADCNIMEIIMVSFIASVLKISPRGTTIPVNFRNSGKSFMLSATSRITVSNLKSALPSLYPVLVKGKKADFNTFEKSDDIGFNLVLRTIEIYNGKMTALEVAGGCRFEIEFSPEIIADKDKPSVMVRDSMIMQESKKTISVQENDLFDFGLLPEYKTPPNILFVAGHTGERNFIKNILSHSCSVTIASNGAEALEILNSPDYKRMDLIISDYNLAIIDGAELFEKCNYDSLTQDIPFIMMTPVNEKENMPRLLKKGLADCLVTPFSIEDLTQKIQAVLSVSQKIRHSTMSRIGETSFIEEPQKKTEKQHAVQDNPEDSTGNLDSFDLSAREKQIALLIAEGKTDKEISAELKISPLTVATHNKKIFKKINVHSRVELMQKLR